MNKSYRFRILVVLLIALAIFGISGPLNCTIQNLGVSKYPSILHILNLALIAYAHDHDGTYPTGKTSTEVFQQLLDQGYLPDGKYLYVDYPSLTYKFPSTSKLLSPENVCYDITSGVDTSSPDNLPIIFLTGYKVSYQAGYSAMPLKRTWSKWWNRLFGCETMMLIEYKDGTDKVATVLDDGSIPNFIPADFDPKGKTYRQLTP